MSEVMELVQRLDARWWALAALAEFVFVLLLVVPAAWRRHRARRRLAAARAERGVRAMSTADGDGKWEGANLFEAIRDDCLRRGWPLPDARWIAHRAVELGGGAAAVEQAERDVAAARGEG